MKSMSTIGPYVSAESIKSGSLILLFHSSNWKSRVIISSNSTLTQSHYSVTQHLIPSQTNPVSHPDRYKDFHILQLNEVPSNIMFDLPAFGRNH